MSIFEILTYFISPLHFPSPVEYKPKIENIINIKKQTQKQNIIKKTKKIQKKEEYKLKAYKDYLFRYIGGIIKTEYNGDIKYIDYDMKRDIEDRDIIDVDRVFDKYVEILPKSYKKEKKITSKYGTEYYWNVQNPSDLNKDIKIVLLYFHGMGGNYHQGVNDYTFGGNFNRIQNLMVKNKGVYISAGFSDFYKAGTEDITVLLKKLRIEYPNAKIMLSGASSGGTLLWNILEKEENRKMIKGILLIGSVVNMKTDIYNYNIPIYIGHGTRDPNIGYTSKYAFYKRIKQYNPGYPIKIEFFQGGIHGTPVRMVNWKDSINWILDFYN